MVAGMFTLTNRRGRSMLRGAVRATFLSLLPAVFAFFIPAAHAGDPDYVLKAKLLIAFGQPQYANWPAGAFPGASSPFVIGVLGDESVSGELESRAGTRTAGGRRITIRRAKGPEELKGCHVVFIGKSEIGRASSILSALAGTNALTVSDAENFTQQGGGIGLFLRDERFRFHINATAARRAGVVLMAEFLGKGE